MASLMGVAFMLSSLGTLCAESSGDPNNPDKTCTYKKKCPSCSGDGGSCGDTPPEDKPVTIQVSKDEECPSDPTEVGLDDSYELSGGGGARSLSGTRATQPVKIAGGFSPNFVNPSNLKIFGTGAEVIRDADTNIRQVKGDTGFMDAVFTPETKTLELRMYKPDDIKAGKVNGLYQVKDGRTAHMILRYVQEADNSFRRETVNNSGEFPSVKSEKTTQTVGPEPYTITHAKTYLKGEGLSAVEYRRVTNKITAIPNGEPQEEKYLCTMEEMGTDGQWYTVERKAGRRATYKEEDGSVLLYECNAVNEDGTPMNPIATETTCTYYSDPLVPASFGKVRTLRRNDGYWENKYYDANTNAGLEMTRTESPWLNTAAHEPGEAPQGQIRVKQETYCNTDTGTEDITETVGGITIAKEWTEKSCADRQKVRLVRHQPHSGGDKITTTVRYRNAKDIPVHLRGKTVSTHYADGSMDLFTYTLSGQNLTVTKDNGYGGESGVTHGTRIVSTEDKDNGNLKEEIRYALEGGQSYWLGSKTGVTFDNAGVCLKWVYDNNPDDYMEQRKDCCHVTWQRGRDGAETEYTYNAQGRVIAETTHGITKTTECNGLSTIIWKAEAGSAQRYLEKGHVRDMAGNLIEEITPAVGGGMLTTRHTYLVPQRTVKTLTPYDTTKEKIWNTDQRILTATSSAGIVTTYGYTATSDQGGSVITNASDSTGSVVTKTDLLGNIISEQKANGAATRYVYDTAGRLVKTHLPDGEVRLFVYSADGSQTSGWDLNGNGTADVATDRLNRQQQVFDPAWPADKGSWKTITQTASNGKWLTTAVKWSSDDLTLVRTFSPGVSGYTVKEVPSIYRQGTNYHTNTTFPDGRKLLEDVAVENGVWRAVTTTVEDSQGNTVSTISEKRDVWGHVKEQINERSSVTHYEYDPASGKLLKVTDSGNAVTSYSYDSYGRLGTTTFSDGTEQYRTYDALGNLVRQWGNRQYPVEYEYDTYGRMTAIHTYRAPVSTDNDWPADDKADKTKWVYSPQDGTLTRKEYADGSGESYTYTPGGKLKTLTNARGHITTHSYDKTGQEVAVTVNDGGKTPSRTYSYDQRGQLNSAVTEGVSSYLYEYNDSSQLIAEVITLTTGMGDLSRNLIRNYDNQGRLSGYQLKHGDFVEQVISYTYDHGGRLAAISAGTDEFTYSYQPNSQNIVAMQTGPLHQVVNTLEQNKYYLTNRVNSWKNKADNSVISSFSYTTNDSGQRTSASTAGEAFTEEGRNWIWTYDDLGHVATANDFHYQYDRSGNRTETRRGDTVTGTYSSNNCNQYLSLGSGNAPGYDADGNLLHGLPSVSSETERSSLFFAYDANSRPIEVKQGEASKDRRTYDHLGRRILAHDAVTLYDGYDAIAEYDANTRALKRSYAWGLDMANSLQATGGVGALLSITNHAAQVPTTYYPLFDGNGNITEYISAENGGNIASHYEYDAFGNIIRQTGNMEFAYRFSTKPYDALTGLYYYNYRDYDPVAGRWLTRDPIGEKGGINLYAVNNDLINTYDYLGLAIKESECRSAASKIIYQSGTLSGRLQGIVNDMKKRKCPMPTIYCSCCEHARGSFTPSLNSVEFCYKKAGNVGELIETIQHEMTHAWQECKKKSTNTCEAVVCEEIQAYLNSGRCQRLSREIPGLTVRECVIKLAASSASNYCGDVATAEAEARKSYEKCNISTPAP